MINKSHVIQLILTKTQLVMINKSFGVKRHSFNWALETWNELSKKGETPSATSLVKLQNSIKRTNTPFYLEVSKTCCQYACWDVEAAWKKYFENKKKGVIDKLKDEYIFKCKKNNINIDYNKLNNIGKPNFKKKGKSDSYVAIENNVTFKQENKKIKLPKIGWVKCCENLRFEGKINNVVIKRIADKYFAIVNMTTNDAPIVCKNQDIIGVDLGIKSLATCSNGKIFNNPKALKNGLTVLKKLQRKLSKKQKNSNNSKKLILKIAKKHYRISNIRKNALHEATTYLSKNFAIIRIEDLKVSDMLKNKRLTQAISDVGFYEFRRQLEYKTKWYGSKLEIVDRWYPSSKQCSCCGNIKKELKLSARIYNCNICGYKEDRDINASKNLANYSPNGEPHEVTPLELK